LIKHKTYNNGLRLVVETLKGFPSVVANITVGCGSNDDPKGKEGIAHFLEHMAFKGTNTRTSSEIANAFESVGSVINAATSNDFIKFFVKCISEDVSFCFELLSDVFLNSTLPELELEKERLVVLQELAMIEDDPENVVSELLAGSLYAGNTQGNPVGGFFDTVSSITRNDMLNFKNKNFTFDKTVISFAGNISFDEAEKLVEKYFINSQLKGADKPFVFSKVQIKASNEPSYIFKQKKIVQNHVILSFPGINLFNKNSTKMLLLSFFLGGGMSSRLFQRIREEHGLVYNISAFDNASVKSGNLEIYFATEEKNMQEAFKEIKEELEKISCEGIQDEEFEKIKKFLKNLLLMLRENLDFVASGNAKEILCYGKPRSVGKEIKKMEIIKKHELEDFAKKTFDFSKAVVAVVGNKTSKSFVNKWLK